MTELKMPARIWVTRDFVNDWHIRCIEASDIDHSSELPQYPSYYRSDLAERMAEALEPFAQLADICDHFNHHDSKRICRVTIDGVPRLGASAGECRAARSALSAFRSAAQDTGDAP